MTKTREEIDRELGAIADQEKLGKNPSDESQTSGARPVIETPAEETGEAYGGEAGEGRPTGPGPWGPR